MSMDPDPRERPSYVITTEPESTPPPRGGPTNGFAIASLVLGIVGLTGFPIIPSVLALIFGYKGKAEIDRSNGYQHGRGMAVAGLVLGWVGIALLLLFVALFLIPIIGLGVFQGRGP